MMKEEVRLKEILMRIQALQASNESLKRECESLRNQLIDQEKQHIKVKQERKEESGMSVSQVEMRSELDRHIEEIDACLDLLKTI